MTEGSSLHPLLSQDVSFLNQKLQKDIQTLAFFEAVSLVALVVISVASLIAPLLASSMSYTLSFSLFSGVFASPWIVIQWSKLISQKRSLHQQFIENSYFLERFETIKPEDIKKMRNQNNLSIPDTSLRTAIAWMDIYIEQFRDLSKEIKSALTHSKEIHEDSIRHAQIQHAWQKLEFEALPAKINAAFALQLIQSPFFNGVPSDLFQYVQKSFSTRQADRIFCGTDIYLVSLKDPKIHFTFEELVRLEGIDDLRRLIFEAESCSVNNLTFRPNSF